MKTTCVAGKRTRRPGDHGPIRPSTESGRRKRSQRTNHVVRLAVLGVPAVDARVGALLAQAQARAAVAVQGVGGRGQQGREGQDEEGCCAEHAD